MRLPKVLWLLTTIILLGWASSVLAHTFFFGLTEISVNSQSKKIEIIHQFTAHDVENLIAEQQQISFSPEHPKYEQLIKVYFEQHFTIQRDKELIKLNWIGLEVQLGKIYLYQESDSESFLSGLVVKNGLLVDTYPKQVNTVNYQDTVIKGSLTFSQSQQSVKIESITSVE
ncbi:MAG: hypothetical protein MJK12_06320 [Colwellia sp.]|nr:hypothetical protein [Colwellia sp.]